MSSVTTARTVRVTAPNQSSQSASKPVTPFQSALDAFRKCEFADPTSEASLRALDALVTATAATGDDVAAATAAVEAATETLRGHKQERAALVTRQRRAIRAALEAGFNGQTVAARFSVSGGTVSAVKGGLDLAAALVKGGMPQKEVPSADALVSRVQTASKVKGGRAALVSHARKTGTLPEDGDVPTFTAAQTLAAVQRALDAVKHIVRADGDTDTVEAIRDALETLSTATIA